VVLRAQRPEETGERHEALAELCRTYWFPLYAFARREGWSPQDAEDHTQNFFSRLLATNLFASVAADRGRLRTFLLTAFRHDLADSRRTNGRQKRGGTSPVVAIDRTLAETRLQADPALQVPAENAYDRHWAAALLETTLAKLAAEYRAAGRGTLFEILRPHLGFSEESAADPATTAAELGMSAPAFRQTLHRLRTRFRGTLRRHIADTLANGEENLVEQELASLRAALAG